MVVGDERTDFDGRQLKNERASRAAQMLGQRIQMSVLTVRARKRTAGMTRLPIRAFGEEVDGSQGRAKLLRHNHATKTERRYPR